MPFPDFFSWTQGFEIDSIKNDPTQTHFLKKAYQWTVAIVGLGGFCLFYFSAASMLQLLQYMTIISFLLSPIIAFLNLRAIQSKDIPVSHLPSKWMMALAYLGLIALILFSLY